MPTDAPTQCPTCGRVMGGSSPIRVHHEQNHGLSLAGIPEAEWTAYIDRHADQIENPRGVTAKERAQAPRHPAYADVQPRTYPSADDNE